MCFDWGVVFVPKEKSLAKEKLIAVLGKGQEVNEGQEFMELVMEHEIYFHNVLVPEKEFAEFLLMRLRRTKKISNLDVPTEITWDCSRNLTLLGHWNYTILPVKSR